jgi:putative ABC transport system permease protein
MDGLNNTNRDLWMGTSMEYAPTAIGGVENGILDAHEIASQVQARPEVKRAQAVGFQSVYVSPDGSGFRTIVGMGVTGTSAPIPVARGRGFSRGDVHYAGGSYDGPWTGEVIVDERTAALLGVSPGDTLHVGGTIGGARETEFTVVGVSSGISGFVGAPTVILHLSELQSLTGKTGSDAASLITITVTDESEAGAIAAELERAFPGHTVRTNEEQLESILQRQAPVILGTVTIVALAVVIGLALVVNVAALLVYGQRVELAALKVAGVSTRTLVATTGTQGVAIGLLGGALGLAATPPAAVAVNRIVADLTGTDALIAIRPLFLAGGMALAVAMGIAGAAVSGWLVGRISPLAHLES